MSKFRFQWELVLSTAVLFIGALAINEWVFTNAEFIRGINWMYLPAGIRLLCTLLFGASGALGVLIASWITCFVYYFPDDVIRSTAGGIISAAAPYLAYRYAQHAFGLQSNLSNLTTVRLLICALIYALFNVTLHHAWFAITESSSDFPTSFLAMLVGDLSGSIVVLYLMKSILAMMEKFAKKHSRHSA